MSNSNGASTSIECGAFSIPVVRRPWAALRGLPYRKTYRLKPGELWRSAEVTEKQTETLAQAEDGPIPVGALIARELEGPGTAWVVFTELWGRKPVLVDSGLTCVALEGERADLVARLRSLNGDSLSGLPDVIGMRTDGTVILREAKTPLTGDRLRPNQRLFFARVLEGLPGRVDAAIVEWGGQTS